MRPTRVYPLFSGGDLNPRYNEGRTPIEVAIPATAKRVELWSLVTGHGSAASQCAEFCDHQHELTLSGRAHRLTFPEAGTVAGCMNALADGVVPNQAGTWWYGRGGWCPGQQVQPWVVDVTADARPGSVATVTYRAFVAGRAPPDGAGNIVLTSRLVIYE